MNKTLKTWALLLGAALALAAGCAQEENINVPNLPPETYVAVGDSVRNPTVYMQTVNWWGEDKDGEVVGYEYRWLTDPGEPCCPMDTSWTFTELTSMDFNLPVTDGFRSHTILVRAIDNEDAADPDPARATFPVTNSPPTLMLWNAADLPDTTLPAIAVKWHADDPEGAETIESYRVWLDGQEDDGLLLAADDTSAALGPDDFEGRYGDRTMYIVAIDSGCDTSNVVSHTWYVEQPEGGILLVDDLSKEDYTAPQISDRFYRGALDSCAGAYTTLDLGEFGGLSYMYNLPELFKMFDLVVWYNDPLRPATDGLATVDGAFEDYVADGGRFLLISLGAVGSGSALADSAAFVTFGIDSLYMRNDQTNFDCKRWDVKGNTGLGLDSLRVTGLFQGVECMKPAPGAAPLYYIPPGTISAAQTEDYYLGVMNSPQGGKAALVTFPMSRGDYYGNARNEFCKLIDLMLD
jgi:hypothetical protein